MKYWMKFYNGNEIDLSLSDTCFMGKDLNISELRRRFIDDFIFGNLDMVKISFLDKGINKSFIAGFRKQAIVIIDVDSKKEFTTKEFNDSLDELEILMEEPIPEPYLE